MIAAEADVNVALVNYHFKNKENLFNEVINQILIRAKEFLNSSKTKKKRRRASVYSIFYCNINSI